MARKIKNVRTFCFKAYKVNNHAEFNSKNELNEYKNELICDYANRHTGAFVFKSECEYYVEKNILDLINNSANKCEDDFYLIYKISTIEDSEEPDKLIMVINYNKFDEIINID